MKKLFLVFIWVILIQSVFGQKFVSSNIPVCILNTNGQSIPFPSESRVTASLKIIYNGDGVINYLTDNPYYQGSVGIRYQGDSVDLYPQNNYSFELKNSELKDTSVALFGMPSDGDWVLFGLYNDYSLLRTALTYSLWEKMGHWAPRYKFCELIVNGSYKGVYLFTESIKRSSKRINVSGLNELDTLGRALTGGYILEMNNVDTLQVNFASKINSVTGEGNNWNLLYPKKENIVSQQQDYISLYVHLFEDLLLDSDFSNKANGYRELIDVESFIDYLIINEFSGNPFGYRSHAYFYKEKSPEGGGGGLINAGPVWDYNHAYSIASFSPGFDFTKWMYEGEYGDGYSVPGMWRRMMTDPYFTNALYCRYNELRSTILSLDSINVFIDTFALSILPEPQARHFTRWLLADKSTAYSSYSVQTYSEEIDILKFVISGRVNWLDNAITGSCDYLSADEIHKPVKVSVFPNPAFDKIYIQANRPINRIELISPMNILLDSYEIPHLMNVELSVNRVFSEGMCVMRIFCEDGTIVSEKIILK